MNGNSKDSYKEIIEKFNLDTLEDRRDKLCLKFAKKCLKNPRFRGWFPKKQSMGTRSNTNFIEPRAHTKRFQMSSIPHMIRLLNSN